MTPQSVRVLAECDTMLADITRRYATARQRLADAEPGYPTQTPGAGQPGSGKGYTAGSITEREADRPHLELEANNRLNQHPRTIYELTSVPATRLGYPLPAIPNSPRGQIRRLVFARWFIRRILTTDIDVNTAWLQRTHRLIIDLHRTVMTWSANTTGTKTPIPRDVLADDLTGELCRSCLRIGTREPRHRGDLCRWCYEFHRGEGFLPPTPLLEIKGRRKVYDRDVEPFRHRERAKHKKRGVQHGPG